MVNRFVCKGTKKKLSNSNVVKKLSKPLKYLYGELAEAFGILIIKLIIG